MSVELMDSGVVALHGHCASEDAETLLGLLSGQARTVDWQDCETAHAAVVQVLLVSGAPLIGPPRGEFLSRFVEPALKAQ